MTDRVDDERILFYLRHQELIDTWAALRGDVRKAADTFYRSLSDSLAEAASGLGAEVHLWSPPGAGSIVGLALPSWQSGGAPLVAAGFEWGGQATFADGVRLVGLRVHYETAEGRQLRPYLGDAVRELRELPGFPRRSNVWPAYRDASLPGPNYWEDLGQYRTALISEIVSAWEAFSQLADEAVRRWRSEAGASQM